MKVNPIYTSKIIKKGLEFAADNSALFAAGTTLVLSTAIRPLSILATPKTDKENKKIACAKSISSSAIGYLLMLGISRPFARSIKAINQNPQKFLKKETIKNLKDGSKTLAKSKAYMLATQMFKLGLGLVIAAPKAMITALGVPVAMKLFKQEEIQKPTAQPTFTGKERTLSKGIAKILDNPKYQEFAKKFKNSNFPMHIVAGTDALATATFVSQAQKSSKIPEERKKPLIHNAIISTALSIIASYIADKLLDKPTEKFIQKFKEVNKGSPKLSKYVEGIRIAKPILIMGGIYYTIIPVISTFLADRTAKNNNEK